MSRWSMGSLWCYLSQGCPWLLQLFTLYRQPHEHVKGVFFTTVVLQWKKRKSQQRSGRKTLLTYTFIFVSWYIQWLLPLYRNTSAIIRRPSKLSISNTSWFSYSSLIYSCFTNFKSRTQAGSWPSFILWRASFSEAGIVQQSPHCQSEGLLK